MGEKIIRNYHWIYIIACWITGLSGGLLFWLVGVTAEWRIGCFIGGNLFGMTSTWFLMKMYSVMNVNVAAVLSSAGSFIVFQLILWKLFHASLSGLQWLGLTLVAAGMVMVVLKSDSTKQKNLS